MSQPAGHALLSPFGTAGSSRPSTIPFTGACRQESDLRRCTHALLGPARRGACVRPGGNGISSAVSVCMELAVAAAATPGLPCLLVWASRCAGELETMGPLVLGMAQALQLQLTTKLFFTGALTN